LRRFDVRLAKLLLAVACTWLSASTTHNEGGAFDHRTLPNADVRQLLTGDGIFYDEDGLIIHREGGRPDGKPDGGDTAQREGWYWLGVWIRANTPGLQPWTPPRRLNFDQVLALLEPGHDGVFYRHPKMAPFNNPRSKDYGFSRDQMVPLVAAMGVWGKHAAIRRLWDALPEDVLGKHAFNGNWRNFLGQDGQDCTSIKKRGCDATKDCSLTVDTRDCSLKLDTRDCSLKTDNTDCSLQQDTRNCGNDIGLPFGGKIHVNDPICEAAKAAQNAAYATAKAACETGKAAKNAGYKAEHDACESGKAAQNGSYAAEKAACETGKASQNALYKADHDACEVAKTSGKMACEGQKAADQLLCAATNVHSGDLIGPMTVNLFRRALGEDPMNPVASIYIPPIDIACGVNGDTELLVNSRLRIAAGDRDRDDVGDDLNHIVALLVSQLRSPSPLSKAAVSLYVDYRPHSYGSFLGAYAVAYGNDETDMANRIANGIRNGWQPDTTAPVGAVRWYHRRASGGNPALAELYEPVVHHFLK
jgi:hypothetical protein